MHSSDWDDVTCANYCLWGGGLNPRDYVRGLASPIFFTPRVPGVDRDLILPGDLPHAQPSPHALLLPRCAEAALCRVRGCGVAGVVELKANPFSAQPGCPHDTSVWWDPTAST